MADLSETRQVAGVAVGVLNAQDGRDYQEDFFFTAQNAPLDISKIHGFLQTAFKTTADKFVNATDTGSTGTIAIVTPDQHITTAHLGDSPAVLFVCDHKTGNVKAHLLTPPHNSKNAKEEARVTKAQGFFWGGDLAQDYKTKDSSKIQLRRLGITRSFGDKFFKAISDDPEINRFNIRKYAKPNDRVFLCVTSDGVLGDNKEMLPESYETLIANALGNSSSPQEIAQKMAKRARDKGGEYNGTDNKTVLFTELPREGLSNSLILGVCDGHGGTKVAQGAAQSLEAELSKPITPQLPGPKIT